MERRVEAHILFAPVLECKRCVDDLEWDRMGMCEMPVACDLIIV